MSNLSISIFGSKIFLEIMNEIKLFSKYEIKYYDDLKACLNNSEKKNLLTIFFINEKQKNFYDDIKKYHFPMIGIFRYSNSKNIFSGELKETLDIPFTIFELEKKIVSLAAKSEFKKNSLIQLGDYIIDKNERKIKKGNLELSLSEKEVNFLVLFSNSNDPVSKNIVLKNVWNYSLESETHTVETHIHRLRKKIFEKFNDNNFIKNNNKGYYI